MYVLPIMGCGPYIIYQCVQEDNDDLLGGGAQNIMTLDGEIMALNGRVLTGQACWANMSIRHHQYQTHLPKRSDISTNGLLWKSNSSLDVHTQTQNFQEARRRLLASVQYELVILAVILAVILGYFPDGWRDFGEGHREGGGRRAGIGVLVHLLREVDGEEQSRRRRTQRRWRWDTISISWNNFAKFFNILNPDEGN